MSLDVRAALEGELAAFLNNAGILDVPTFAGAADAERPDRYVSVVAGNADPRGSRFLVSLELRVVAPVDGYPVSWAQGAVRILHDWATTAGEPLNGYESATLLIYGSSFPAQRSEVASRSRAEILELKVGASAL